MNPGDLVRINVRPRYGNQSWFYPNNGKLGVIVESRKRGPLDVWLVLIEGGRMISFESDNLEAVT